jgi:hypothetical protein
MAPSTSASVNPSIVVMTSPVAGLWMAVALVTQ